MTFWLYIIPYIEAPCSFSILSLCLLMLLSWFNQNKERQFSPKKYSTTAQDQVGGAMSGFEEFGFRESGTQEPFILFPLILPVGTYGFLERNALFKPSPIPLPLCFLRSHHFVLLLKNLMSLRSYPTVTISRLEESQLFFWSIPKVEETSMLSAVSVGLLLRAYRIIWMACSSTGRPT